MSFNPQSIKTLLKKGELRKLFIEELGWDGGKTTKECNVDGNTYQLIEVAQKAGFKVWLCNLPSSKLPQREETKKVHSQLVKESFEHIIIFLSNDSKSQSWLWVRRETNKPISYKYHLFTSGQAGESLVQKLRELYIAFEEEEKGVNIIDITSKAKKAFDVEKVTKKFYQEFDKQRKVFLGFIKGIPVDSDREWYASVMLNRLMFAYLIQKKRFLDSNPDYLNTKLKECQQKKGQDKFYSFYRIFLLRLFHEGLGTKKVNRPKGLESLLGNIPYLNGGMFDVHELELPERYGKTIEIKDEAFQDIFAYFDQYQWHLDERPLKNDNEINPDVLGYIFEKYINQKQMGAYYTKEDVTEYISKSTIIPFIFDSTRARYPGTFDSTDLGVWGLLKKNPDEYIFSVVRHGIEYELPEDITLGIDTSKPQLSKRRSGWNKIAPANFALPKETWREVVARRQRYSDIKKKLINGEVNSIDHLITLNLDIRQFALEVIDNCSDPDLVWAFWQSIYNISILDPTGGSGAFLFASLNILEPLYEACLERMEVLLHSGLVSARLNEFKEVLSQAEGHVNRKYFILKSIILNNLYAVDIMEEAVEICKLRLFLKLAAQVDPDESKENFGIEPLPDIDFNIRAGNTLVGYATSDEVKSCMTLEKTTGRDQMKLLVMGEDDIYNNFAKKLKIADEAFRNFRKKQIELGGSVKAQDKIELQSKLNSLEKELNNYLASEYSVKTNNKQAYEDWVKSHKPFHWFIQFYSILDSGGFDVIIGNPPYVPTIKVRSQYKVQNLTTLDCPDIYAACMERSLALLKPKARFGMIIPISFQFGGDFEKLREICKKSLSDIWASTFSRNPSALFSAGLGVRNTICLGCSGTKHSPIIHTSKLNRWVEEFRPMLFQSITYTPLPVSLQGYGWPRLDGPGIAQLFNALVARGWRLDADCCRGSDTIRFKGIALYYISAFVKDPPILNSSGGQIEHTGVGELRFSSAEIRDVALILALGKIALVWWAATGDDFHVTASGLGSTPLQCSALPGELNTILSSAAYRIQRAMDKNIIYTKYAGKIMGNYDIKCVRDILDETDILLLKALNLEDHWEDIELAYAHFMKATGERHGTVRDNPFG